MPATGAQKRPCKKDYVTIVLILPVVSKENVLVMRDSEMTCSPCQTTDVAFSVVESDRVAR